MALISDPISAVSSVAKLILGRVLPDKQAQEAASAQLDQMLASGEIQAQLGQLEVDKAEAGSQSTFVAGWRPAVGWICAAGLASQFVIRPMFTWIAGCFGSSLVYPTLDTSTLMSIVFAMLGIGAHEVMTSDKFTSK